MIKVGDTVKLSPTWQDGKRQPLYDTGSLGFWRSGRGNPVGYFHLEESAQVLGVGEARCYFQITTSSGATGWIFGDCLRVVSNVQ